MTPFGIWQAPRFVPPEDAAEWLIEVARTDNAADLLVENRAINKRLVKSSRRFCFSLARIALAEAVRLPR